MQQPHRRLHRRRPRAAGLHARRRRPTASRSSAGCQLRPDRPAADAGGGGRLRQGPSRRRLREAGRSAAGLAALRRAHGDVLARPGALRRHRRLPQRQPPRRLRCTAITSSTPSTRNKPFDRSPSSSWPATCCRTRRDEQRIASGYNRLLQTTEEGGAQAKEYTAKYAADRVRNASVVWLASTMGCCECHNHKFDPFTNEGFLQLRGVLRRREGDGRRPAGADAVAVRRSRRPSCSKLDEQIAAAKADARQADAGTGRRAGRVGKDRAADAAARRLPPTPARRGTSSNRPCSTAGRGDGATLTVRTIESGTTSAVSLSRHQRAVVPADCRDSIWHRAARTPTATRQATSRIAEAGADSASWRRRQLTAKFPDDARLHGGRAAHRCACCRAATGWTTPARSCSRPCPRSCARST